MSTKNSFEMQTMNPAFLTPGTPAPTNNYDPAVVLDNTPNNFGQVRDDSRAVEEFLGRNTLAEIERTAIIATIRACKGNKAASARSLGISEKSIYNKMRRLNISNADLAVNKPEIR